MNNLIFAFWINFLIVCSVSVGENELPLVAVKLGGLVLLVAQRCGCFCTVIFGFLHVTYR